MLSVVHSTRKWVRKTQDHERLHYRSLFLFTKSNNLRKVLHKICKSWVFEYFILFSIVTSCVIVVLEDQTEKTDGTTRAYAVADLALNIIFGTEAIMKIIAFGFILHRGAYLRNNWNVFDFVVVISGFASDIYALFAESNKSLSLKALRLFRVVRPLRLIAKSDNLRVVLDTLVKSFGTLMHVLLFIFLLIILYAITGMELFGGVLHSACYDQTTLNIIEPVKLCSLNIPTGCQGYNNSICLDQWDGLDGDMVSFDNIYVAIITVIQVITMEDWIFIQYKIDAVASTMVTSCYFVSLILIGGYFAVDLLMGVLGNQYLRTKQCIKKSKEMRQQKKAIEDKLDNINNKKQTEKEPSVMEQPKKEDSVIQLKQTSSSFLSLKKTDKKTESKFRKIITRIAKSQAFFWCTMTIVVVDVTMSSVYAHTMDFRSHDYTFIYIQAVIILFYIIELAIKAIHKSLRRALQNGLFFFNASVVMLSLIEMILLLFSAEYYIGLSVIRGVTLILVFKHTRFWSQMSMIIKSFVESIKGVTGIMGLLFIVLANYALLGNQLFGQKDGEGSQLGTFDTFESSLLLSFVLLTGDNWTTFMSENIKRATDETTRVFTVLYFISFVLLGNFILMNVFLGIIVDNLTSDWEENNENDVISSRDIKIKSIGVFGAISRKTNEKQKTIDMIRSTKVSDINHTVTTISTSKTSTSLVSALPSTQQSSIACETTSSTTSCSTTPSSAANKNDEENNLNVRKDKVNANRISSFVDNTIKNTTVRFQDSNDLPTNLVSIPTEIKRQRRFTLSINSEVPERMRAFSLLLDPDIMHPIPKHKALFIFDQKNEFRLRVFNWITGSEFTLLVGVTILLSSLLMAFGDPLERDVERGKIMQYFDYGFTAIFFGEMILKSIAYGFVFGHSKCYLRDPMNMLDFFVLLISAVNIIITYYGTTRQISFRVLRVIRIVRMLKVSPKLKRVINCLINSVQKIIYFLALYILILFLYSVIGVQLYRDAIKSCTNPQIYDSTLCISSNHTWDGNQLTFKNIGSGMTTLFVLSTMDDWFKFLEKLIKTESVSTGITITYIVSFILIMSFVMLNVFIGFVIVVFHKEKDKTSKCKILTKGAQECIVTALSENPSTLHVLPKLPIQLKLWKLVTSPWFHTTSILLIVLNTIFLITKTYKQSNDMTNMQHYANIIFTVLFTVEILLKFIAFSWAVVIKDSWLIFDTLVVIGSWIDIMLDLFNVSSVKISLFRLFRVLRLAKVVGKGGNLRQLFSTFLKSMKSVPHIACLLALLLYLYAIIGMELFGKIRLDNNTAINENTNFQSFLQSVMVLIRVTTLDAWHEIMIACADVDSINCQDTSDNCGSYISYFYFASFVFICSYIMTHLFLAVIMDNFVYLTHDISTLDNRHIHKYTALWSKYDRGGTGRITTSDAMELLKILDPPLGCGLLAPKRNIYSKLLKLQIPIEEDMKVKFTELLMCLVLDSLNLRISNTLIRDEIFNLVPDADDDLLDRILPLEYDPRILNRSEKCFYRNSAAFVIGGYYRMYRSGVLDISSIATVSGNAVKEMFLNSTSIVINNSKMQYGRKQDKANQFIQQLKS